MAIGNDYNTSFASREYAHSEQYEKRKQNAEKVATGTAAGGTAAYQAKRYASKKYLRNAFENVTGTARTITGNAKEATTLWGKFKANKQQFIEFAKKQLIKLSDNKFLAPIVKNKVVQGLAAGFGTLMAFFVLVTGVGEAIDTGKIAAGDIKRKLDL